MCIRTRVCVCMNMGVCLRVCTRSRVRACFFLLCIGGGDIIERDKVSVCFTV